MFGQPGPDFLQGRPVVGVGGVVAKKTITYPTAITDFQLQISAFFRFISPSKNILAIFSK